MMARRLFHYKLNNNYYNVQNKIKNIFYYYSVLYDLFYLIMIQQNMALHI